MLTFFIIFTVGVGALLAVQALDVENVRQRQPRRPVVVKPAVRAAKATIAFFNGENAAR
jgi:hypothetical protein